MRIDQIGYVLVHNNRLYEDVFNIYADGRVVEKAVETTTDIQDCKIFEDYEDAKEVADNYGLEIRSIRTQFI